MCLSQEDTLFECDLDHEKLIKEIENLLDSPHEMDLELCKINSKSCSSPSSTSDSHLIEPPPHVDPYVDVKNELGVTGFGSYDFLGVDFFLSHHKVWIGSVFGKPIDLYFVDSTSLLIGLSLCGVVFRIKIR